MGRERRESEIERGRGHGERAWRQHGEKEGSDVGESH